MLSRLFFAFIEDLIRNISGTLGRKIRAFYYKHRLGDCGENIFIDIGVIIADPKYVFLGNNVWLDNYVLILSGPPSGDRKIYRKKNVNYHFNEGELHLSDNVHIAPFVVIQSHGGVSIGPNCGIASGSKIYSFSNHYKDLNYPEDPGPFHFTPLAPLQNQAYILASVVLEGDNAVGLNSVVLPGTTLPSGTWLGTGSFIQGSNSEKESIYSGDAAKFIKTK
jgi:acetyltransferase-like isoleucine patch superfamily enzyme